jgi:hypothetical protein
VRDDRLSVGIRTSVSGRASEERLSKSGADFCAAVVGILLDAMLMACSTLSQFASTQATAGLRVGRGC